MNLSSLALGVGMLAVCAAVTLLIFSAAGPVEELVKSYRQFVSAQIRLMFLPMTVRQFAWRHVGIAVGTVAVASYLVDGWLLPAMAGIIGIAAPLLWLKKGVEKRRDALEAQLDSALQSMANTILVTQNLQDAFETLSIHFDAPLKQDADLIVKQMRLGTPVDVALREWSQRVKSRPIDAIVTALTVGRLTGGDLPKVLNATSAVLRETIRVEGVMKTKTSEGKAQAAVIAGVPVFFGFVMNFIDPAWMRPLFHDPVGWVLLGIACLLEGIALILVRKITTLDA